MRKKVGGLAGMGRPHAREQVQKATKRVKKIGSLVPDAIDQGTTRGHRKCDDCTGRVIDGNWVHSSGCHCVEVLWDFDDSSWFCFFGCKGVRLTTSRTHVWDCEFWHESADAIPF